MFEFIKNNKHNVKDEDIILELMNTKLFKSLVKKVDSEPTETLTICCMVITFGLHSMQMPAEMFDEVVDLMKNQYRELPSPELMKIMKEFNLI